MILFLFDIFFSSSKQCGSEEDTMISFEDALNKPHGFGFKTRAVISGIPNYYSFNTALPNKHTGLYQKLPFLIHR